MDLRTAIADAIVAMDLFFNNRFAESKAMYQKLWELFSDDREISSLDLYWKMFVRTAVLFVHFF